MSSLSGAARAIRHRARQAILKRGGTVHNYAILYTTASGQLCVKVGPYDSPIQLIEGRGTTALPEPQSEPPRPRTKRRPPVEPATNPFDTPK